MSSISSLLNHYVHLLPSQAWSSHISSTFWLNSKNILRPSSLVPSNYTLQLYPSSHPHSAISLWALYNSLNSSLLLILQPSGSVSGPCNFLKNFLPRGLNIIFSEIVALEINSKVVFGSILVRISAETPTTFTEVLISQDTICLLNRLTG